MRHETATSTSGIAALAAVVAVFMIAQQIASKAVRDGFFLSEFEVTALPIATLAAAIVSFGAALVLGKFMSAFSPAAAVPVLFAANGVLFAVEAAFVVGMPQLIAAALYLHTAAFGGAVVSGFWSVINERFDPYTAKKVVGRIAGGATVGGVAGGALTWLFSDVEPEWLLAGFAASSVFCAVGIAAVARGGPGDVKEKKGAPLLAGLSVIASHRYPRFIAAIVFLSALMTAIIDYVFKAGVVEADQGGSLVGFFAVFYTATGIATFLAQAVGSRRLLKLIGVVPTVGLLPAVASVLLGLALFSPTLFALVLLRGGAMVVENSLYRSGYELLYTPVPREQKRSAKVLIDLGCDRLGTAVASGVVLLVISTTTLAVDRTLLLTALFATFAIVAVLVNVQREYVASLAGKLKRSLRPEREQGEDQARYLATTFVAEVDLWSSDEIRTRGSSDGRLSHVDRGALLEQVHARVAEKAQAAQAPNATVHAPRGVVSEELLTTPLRARLRAADASDAELRQSAPGLIGQLGDILLSRREPVEVRLKAAELLSTVPSTRSAAALLEVMSVRDLRLRRAAAVALLRICTASPALSPSRRVLTDHAAKELRQPSHPIGARTSFERTSPFIEDARGNELAPSLEIVFLLLAIHGDTEELRLALSAITSTDAVQRGTGLEYLDSLLPGHLRGHVLALAEHPELTQADQRMSVELLRSLASDLRTEKIGIQELRRRFSRARRDRYDHGS